MGAKIDIFLNSFNDALLKAIDANSERKANFDKVRADAIKISINKSGNFPNKSSVVTIGDLFGYVFPAEGGIKNEPSAIKYNSPDPEYLTYLEDVNNFKKIYADLKKYYTFSERSNSLKEKGGAQLWFDYFMYFSYRLFLKNDSFLKKIKEDNENSSSEYYQLMPNGGSSVNYYNTFDLFDSLIFGDSNINDYTGLNKFLTSNLSTDELLYDAFIEAGDSYEGPYTKDIKDPVNFINFLDGNVPKSVPDVPPPPPNILFIVATPSTIAATPSPKIPLVVYDIPDDFTIQAKTDMPLFSIYVGDQTKKVYDDYNDLPELDSEYSEDVFRGFEEEIASPDPIDEDVDESASSIEDYSSADSYVPIVVNGGVKLPTGNKGYSHTSSQGYDIIDSKWYGDILSSALAHIDHPTFDIEGTEKGNLGCASWVSMVFYRAFGVSMKDGKAVKSKPKSIDNFGSKSTSVLGNYFKNNPNLWIKIKLEDGQPGDIVNTEKAVKHGHVGVVINQKSGDGTWKIASNSSAGFGSSSDPRGCGKINYTIAGWAKSVKKKNPSGTWCWRYKGPKLEKGQIS